jgi:hypothetical protein
MARLHLGVEKRIYPRRSRGEWRRHRVGQSIVTTEEVADALEERYHILEHFLEMEHDGIMSDFHQNFHLEIDTALSGRKPPKRRWGRFEARVTRRFKDFIHARSLDGVEYGVPTQRSLKGVNRRLSHPYQKNNPSRPSFIDTGLYVNSMKAWVEE